MRLQDDYDYDYDSEKKGGVPVGAAATAIVAIMALVLVVVFVNNENSNKKKSSEIKQTVSSQELVEESKEEKSKYISGSTLTADDLDIWDMYPEETEEEIVENKKICVITFVINNDFEGLPFLFVFAKSLGKSPFFAAW